jgi:hypothetical protein
MTIVHFPEFVLYLLMRVHYICVVYHNCCVTVHQQEMSYIKIFGICPKATEVGIELTTNDPIDVATRWGHSSAVLG